MSSAHVICPTPTPSGRWAAAARRIASLSRAEAILLRRNPSALASALVAPIALVLVPFLNDADPGRDAGFDSGSLVVTGLATFTLLFGVYYNLVTALVARREELVLKRLRTGEVSDAEIIAGTATPAVAIAWGQIALGFLAALVFLDLGAPTNPVLVLAAIALGTAVCVLLAAAMTALTSSVELAQVVATPALVLSMIFSGVMFPLDQLPELAQRAAPGLPLTAVVELMQLGLSGTTPTGDTVGFVGSLGAGLVPLLVLGLWLAAGRWVVLRWFRWEPRR